MKMTLLAMVQNILSAMESDEVNSISDNQEAMEVAYNIQDVYYQFVEQRGVPELNKFMLMTALGDVTKPTYLQIPDTVAEIFWLKYNKQTSDALDLNYENVCYLCPRDFIEMTNYRKSTDGNIQTITDFNSAVLMIQNDKAPQWYTSFDDKYIVCDSFDNTVDTTLQASKTQVFAKSDPTWTMSDDFIPTLDSSVFPFLLAEAKATCFVNMKMQENGKVEKQAKQQLVKWQNDKHRINSINGKTSVRNYGRGSYTPAQGWIGRGPDSRYN